MRQEQTRLPPEGLSTAAPLGSRTRRIAACHNESSVNCEAGHAGNHPTQAIGEPPLADPGTGRSGWRGPNWTPTSTAAWCRSLESIYRVVPTRAVTGARHPRTAALSIALAAVGAIVWVVKPRLVPGCPVTGRGQARSAVEIT